MQVRTEARIVDWATHIPIGIFQTALKEAIVVLKRGNEQNIANAAEARVHVEIWRAKKESKNSLTVIISPKDPAKGIQCGTWIVLFVLQTP